MTKLIADRILHHEQHKIIKLVDVTDPIAKRLLKDDRAVQTTITYLNTIDPRYGILTGRESLLERTCKEIQFELGMKFKLKTLRENYPTFYNRLRTIGNPKNLLEEWGFEVELSNTRLTRKQIRARLWSLARDDKRIVNLEKRSPSTYAVIKRLAKESDMTIKQYIEEVLGFNYGKGR